MADPPTRETDESHESVESLSALYLGNILYALERSALALEEEGKLADAGFYRGIARKLAEARGREKGDVRRVRGDLAKSDE